MRGHLTTNYTQRTFRLLHFVVQWVLADSRMIMKIIEQSVMPHVLLIVMKNYLLFTLVMYFMFADGYIIGQKIEKPQRTCARMSHCLCCWKTTDDLQAVKLFVIMYRPTRF